MSILKLWGAHCSAIDKVQQNIEDIASQLPVSGNGKRLRKTLSDAWDKVSDTTSKLDQMITDSVQPLPVDFKWKDKEFADHWRLYREYLQEQHGIVMKSRMEQARLKAIASFCNGDRALVIKSIDFYMAIGTYGIFEVNFEIIKKESKNDDQPTKVKIKYSN